MEDLSRSTMMRGSNSNQNLDNEVELLLLQQQWNHSLLHERPVDLNINRSGSAPPTVEGAFRAAENLFRSANIGFSTEEEIRSHPEYVEYYYSNENLNPRLPPPLLSREDWRVAQRVRAAGQNRNLNDNSGSSSLFLMQPGLSVKKGEDEMLELRKAALRNVPRKSSSEMLNRGSNGLVGALRSEMGIRRKSFADILQEGLGQPVTSHLSRPASQTTIDVPCFPGIGNTNADKVNQEARFYDINSKALGVPNVTSSGILEAADNIADSLSGLNMSKGQLHAGDVSRSSLQTRMASDYNPYQQQYCFEKNNSNYAYLAKNNGLTRGLNVLNSPVNERMSFPRTSTTPNHQSNLNPSEFANLKDMRILSQGYNFLGVDAPSYGHSGYAFNQELDMAVNDDPAAGPFFSGSAAIHFPVIDPNQFQYLHKTNAASFWGNSSQERYAPHVREDWQALEKAYLEALFLQQQQHHQYLQHSLHKANVINHPYHSNPTISSNQGNSMVDSLHSQSGNNAKGGFEPPLEMAKNSKTKSLELSNILGHVLEFSTDQYGSRFIQQKLETATHEEKTMIYAEIMPHARGLMTDVFGNYVIQRFFEHGTDDQRKGLATHLTGYVLPLSLHMYGCRVIQKALEVVDVELQMELVAELDGSVIKCVHDQNGNHVIQKCIEFVPQDRIEFLISSFFGQVVTLSTHPYGCRVIQRVLEHCGDPKTRQILMDEIMSSICNLAQDQYGNYVLQHVLEHGKPQEQSMIVSKLIGQIVKMSQQKYSSNVIEKCLIFGGPEERKLLVNEMMGSTDENEPLQAMMRDPYGNYVMQKVLETSDDNSRDLILSRIKAHLTALKRYTYGRHFVSRVEKLVAAGEKQTAISSSSSS